MGQKTESCWLQLGKKSKFTVNKVLDRIEKVLVLLYHGGKLLTHDSGCLRANGPLILFTVVHKSINFPEFNYSFAESRWCYF